MNPFSGKKWDARLIYYLLRGGGGLFFAIIFTTDMVYQAQTVGLNALQLVLVGTTLEIAVLLFEVPTGIVADIYSRRLSVIIGVFLIGLGFMLEGSIPRFETILLAQLLWGLGHTFTSGATEAWIVDEIGERNAAPVFLRAAQMGQIGGLVGIVIGTGIGMIGLNLPVMLGGALYIALAVFLVLFMPETGFKPTPREARNSWGTMRRTFTDGLRMVRGRAVLMTMVGVGLFYGLYSEGFDRLWTPHFLDNFTLPTLDGLQPVVWFGIFRIGTMLLGLAATEYVRRRIKTDTNTSAARVLLVITAGKVFMLAIFAAAGNFWLALAAFWAFSTFRSIIEPIFSAWANQNIDSNVRATVLSMFGQVDAVGQIGGGPAVGFIGATFGIRAALMTSTLILTPALWLFARTLRREKQQVVTHAVGDSGV